MQFYHWGKVWLFIYHKIILLNAILHNILNQVMWAMEYNPNIYSLYEESSDPNSSRTNKNDEAKVNRKMLKQYGKFERKNVQTGWKDQRGALAVFLAASVLETKNKRLLKEAQGLDDVVQVLVLACSIIIIS